MKFRSILHPASGFLASESGHIESESAEHDLHCFQAIRRMDEILVANFMVFAELAASEPFDLWVGDEAWDVDYYWHENPELKRGQNVWLTDFVGYLPIEAERECACPYCGSSGISSLVTKVRTHSRISRLCRSSLRVRVGSWLKMLPWS